MAIYSVNEVAFLINQQEHLFERLIKIEAVSQLSLSEDFYDYERSITHAYLWTLADMISEAKTLSEKLLQALLIINR